MFGERNFIMSELPMRGSQVMCQHRQIKLAQFKAERVCEIQLGVFLLEERVASRKASWKG